MKKTFQNILSILFILAMSVAFGDAAHAAAPLPDLSITMVDQTGYVSVGKNIIYTVLVANIGKADAANVRMKATVPDIITYVSDTSEITPTTTKSDYIWYFGLLKAGDSKSFEIIFSTDNLLQTFTQDQIGFVKADATVSTTSIEFNKKNDSATAETLLVPPEPDPTRVI